MLPKRTSSTMGDAIALSSPSGRMSKRARREAEKRLALALFGDYEPAKPKQPTQSERNRRRAKQLRELAGRGMSRRAFMKEAERLEREADELEREEKKCGNS